MAEYCIACGESHPGMENASPTGWCTDPRKPGWATYTQHIHASYYANGKLPIVEFPGGPGCAIDTVRED